MLEWNTPEQKIKDDKNYRHLNYIGIQMISGHRHWGEIYYREDTQSYVLVDQDDSKVIGVFKEAAIAGFLFRN